jgi:hypothetical protein
MNPRPRLTLIHTGMKRLAQREKLIAEARRIFPTNPEHAAKWVEAKLLLGEREPSVEIGIGCVDTSRAVRALPIGSVARAPEIPSFLRRFLKR